MTKLALIGAAVVAVLSAPALAQTVVVDPSYCVNSYPNAACRNLEPGNWHPGVGYDRDWQNANGAMSYQAAEPGAYRYHGGPKDND